MNFRSVTVTAPGKIILHGEHAVVYGKKAVASAIGLRTKLKLELNSDEQVTLNLLNIKTTCKWNAEELQSDAKKLVGSDASCCTLKGRELFNKFVDHCEVTAVDKRLIKDAISVFVFLVGRIMVEFERLPSFSVEVDASIPIGAGLGSSASYCVCLCTALLAATGRILQSSVIASPTGVSATVSSATASEKNVSLSAEDLELICKWSLEAEKLVHGKPSGIDNSVCTYGGVLTFQDGIIKHLTRIPQLKILVTHTKIPRSTKDLVSGLRERYQQKILKSLQALRLAGRLLNRLVDMSWKVPCSKGIASLGAELDRSVGTEVTVSSFNSQLFIILCLMLLGLLQKRAVSLLRNSIKPKLSQTRQSKLFKSTIVC
ncbi:mevalonate kinase-like [Oculina patagonica]